MPSLPGMSRLLTGMMGPSEPVAQGELRANTMPPPLAHHAGEESLAALLLLGTGSLSVVVAIGRAHLAAARARLIRRARPPRDQTAR